MPYRHEYKHRLNYADYIILRERLALVMQRDPHVDAGGEYRIRSLYFDNYNDKALREKLDGLDAREKFRLRCYGADFDTVHLEKKSKLGGLSDKRSALLTRAQTEAILRGDIAWMTRGDPLVVELYSKMQAALLRPKVIVEYVREPFVFAPGNVRVTLDRDIRTALKCTAFFDPALPTVPAGDAAVLLEVKYDAFLPAVIADVVQVGDRRAGAFSKYAACRMYD